MYLVRVLDIEAQEATWPGNELAARLRVSRRTVRRDVERLRDLGYPRARELLGGWDLSDGRLTSPPDTVEWLAARVARAIR